MGLCAAKEHRGKYGFLILTSDPLTIAGLAREAELAGWHGVFYCDGIHVGDFETYDPRVVMAAMAMKTERVRIGTIATPPARPHRWKLARETMTLDHLSGGRLVRAVGLGAHDDGGFSKVGEPTDRRLRARLMDESLEILVGLWSGRPFSFQGEHYRFEEMTFLPPPVQRPRIPIWVVAAWPGKRSMNRALRYDGLLAAGDTPEGPSGVTPETIRAMRAYVQAHRAAPEPFEIVYEGVTPGDDPARAAATVWPFAEAGATWWIESQWSPPNEPADLLRRIS